MKELTPLQRIGINYLILGLLKYDSDVTKGGRIYFKNSKMGDYCNMYFNCYNEKRYVFTLRYSENIDDSIEYQIKYDEEEKIFHIITDDERGYES